ncbi:MAG: TonB-dependent receptor, partial [Acidimicrobiia bacterium]
TRHSATTEPDGRYRLTDVPAGTYRIRVRYIGYTPLVAPLAVSADTEATADIALQKSVQPLDEVVVTGTLIPTEVKALPTPVTVVTASEIALQRPTTMMGLFRQAVPTAVSWDRPSASYFGAFSVRGASNLSGGTAQLKVFVDGTEVALPSVPGIDPTSIERMEVIRGPQAAAIYGSEAIGGVIQIFTKRGDPSLARPRVMAEASLGVGQTPYAGFNDVLRPGVMTSLSGGGGGVSYNLQGNYTHSADWLPNEESAHSKYGVSGGVYDTRGIVALDFSGRHHVQNAPVVVRPEFVSTGISDFSQPNFRSDRFTNQTVGARLSVVATPWWQHTLRVGIDRYTDDLVQSRPRFTFPEDTLLWVINQSLTKTFVAYNTAVQGGLGGGVSGSLTAGFDHHHLPNVSFASFGALNTSGSIQPAPGFPVSASRSVTNNTGYFAQAQLGIRDALFLTAGLRAEQSTNFGDSLGTPLAPRVGVSYVQQVSKATIKLRGSWGRAIRAPFPGMNEG